MKAIRISRTGAPDVLEYADVPEPAPDRDEILVKNEAIGLNFIDVYFRTGLYPASLPLIPGQEAAGVVEAVGEDVTRFRIGDRVAFAGGPGAYAEKSVVRADRAVRLPDEISFHVAAAVMLKGMTAEFLARQIWPLTGGDFVLVHAAAGGVGSLLVQWLHHLGVRVIATAGGVEKCERVKAAGSEFVIDYRVEDIVARVKDITGGRGVRVAYDSVGKDTLDASLGSLGRRGLLVSYGNASGSPPAIEPSRLMRGGSLFLTRPTLYDYIATTQALDASATALFSMIASGSLAVQIGATYKLETVREAHEALEARQTTGSTLLIP